MFMAVELTKSGEQLVMFVTREERDAYVAEWWPFVDTYEEGGEWPFPETR